MATANDPRPFGLTKPIVLREVALVGSASIADVAAAPTLSVGSGNPDGSLTRPRGSLFLRTDADQDAGTYQNTDGSDGWVVLSSGGSALAVGESTIYSDSVAFDDGSSSFLTVPAGQTWLITGAWITPPDTAWDGNGTVAVGDGSDADGFLALSNAQLGGSSPVGLNADERGAYLYDTGNSHVIHGQVLQAAASVIVAPTQGTSTQGEASLFVAYTRIA